MGHIEKAKRNEALLFPEYLDDYVESDCPVHLFDDFVDSLNLEQLGFAKAIPETMGRPSYDPRTCLRSCCMVTSMEYVHRADLRGSVNAMLSLCGSRASLCLTSEHCRTSAKIIFDYITLNVPSGAFSNVPLRIWSLSVRQSYYFF